MAGPPAPAAAIEARLAGQEGAFELKRYRDEAAARAAIEDREVYGAFVAPSGPKVLTASAASPVVSQLLGNSAAAARDRRGDRQDVVAGGPPPRRRSGLVGASTALIAGILTALVPPRRRGIASSGPSPPGPEWWPWPRCSRERSRP